MYQQVSPVLFMESDTQLIALWMLAKQVCERRGERDRVGAEYRCDHDVTGRSLSHDVYNRNRSHHRCRGSFLCMVQLFIVPAAIQFLWNLRRDVSGNPVHPAACPVRLFCAHHRLRAQLLHPHE